MLKTVMGDPKESTEAKLGGLGRALLSSWPNLSSPENWAEPGDAKASTMMARCSIDLPGLRSLQFNEAHDLYIVHCFTFGGCRKR